MLKTVEDSKTRRHPGYRAAERRRAAIIEALRRSMLDKGFAGTSLTELAKRAGMSVSHFLYYFPDKETVLVDLAKSITDETLAFMGSLTAKAPQDQCRELVGFFFGHVPSSYRNLVLQTMGVATHDRQLLARQRHQASKFRAFLRQLFRKSPGRPGITVDDAAAIAAAVWIGLYVNSCFDPGLTMQRAARLMLASMLWLGGLQDEIAINGVSKSRAGARQTQKPRAGAKRPVLKRKKAAAFASPRSG